MNGETAANNIYATIGHPSVAIMIPCHNEEKTIARCVESCLTQTQPPKMVLVVDDGSTDNSVKILETFGNKIKLVPLEKNTGNKSYVQQIGLGHIDADIFISTDADTILDARFVENIEKAFLEPDVYAAAGYVMSTRHNWLTALREIEYFIGQEVHKTAQANINFLYVIPGCASAFRTEAFKKNVTFDHDTVTEDLDFTFKLHRNNDRIAFIKNAVVWTQDPADLKSYINQVRRWYGGGWQNLLKHKDVLGLLPAGAFEISLFNMEAFIFCAGTVIIPFINIELALAMAGMYVLTTTLIGSIAAICRKRADLFFNSPFYIILSYINSYIFFEQFIREVLKKEKNLTWFTPKRRA